MPIHSAVHDELATALAPLAQPGNFKDPAARSQVLHVAQTLAPVRGALEARAQSLAMSRLRALGTTAAGLAQLADRLPYGPLHGVLADRDRTAANWAGGMLEYGWHGLAPTSRIAWAMGMDPAEFSDAADNPTLHWIACGTVPPYLRQSWHVLGGVIDAALLRGLSDLAKSVCAHPDARCPVFASSYRDTVYQMERMSKALLALDVRMQECEWMLARLSDRLDPLSRRVLSALDRRYSAAKGGSPAEYVYSEFDQGQQARIRSGCEVLLRLARVRLLDEAGALSEAGRAAVVAARRVLLGGPSPATPCPMVVA